MHIERSLVNPGCSGMCQICLLNDSSVRCFRFVQPDWLELRHAGKFMFLGGFGDPPPQEELETPVRTSRQLCLDFYPNKNEGIDGWIWITWWHASIGGAVVEQSLNGKNASGLNPSFLCRICVFSLCLRVVLPTIQRHQCQVNCCFWTVRQSA